MLKATPLAFRALFERVRKKFAPQTGALHLRGAAYVRPLNLHGGYTAMFRCRNLNFFINGLRRSPYVKDFEAKRVFLVVEGENISVARLKADYHSRRPSLSLLKANPQLYLEVIEGVAINSDGSVVCHGKEIRKNGSIVRAGSYNDPPVSICLNFYSPNLGAVEEVSYYSSAVRAASFLFGKLTFLMGKQPQQRYSQAIREGKVLIRGNLCEGQEKIEFFLIKEEGEEIVLEPIGTIDFKDGQVQKGNGTLAVEDILEEFAVYVYTPSPAHKAVIINNLNIELGNRHKPYLWEGENCRVEISRRAMRLTKKIGDTEELYEVKIDAEGFFLLPDGRRYLKNGEPVSPFARRSTEERANVNFWDMIYPHSMVSDVPLNFQQIAIETSVPEEGVVTLSIKIPSAGPENTAARMVVLYHPVFRNRLAGEKVQMTLTYEGPTDPVLRVYDSQNTEKPACVLYYDKERGMFYYRPKTSKGMETDVRYYTAAFLKSEKVDCGDFFFCRAHQQLGSYCLVETRNGVAANFRELDGRALHKVPIYNKKRQPIGFLLGKETRNPPVLKEVIGYLPYKVEKRGGIYVLVGPVDMRLTPEVLARLGITTKNREAVAWAHLENGVVTKIYAATDEHFEHPIYLKVIRKSDWTAEASASERIRGADVRGIKIYEGNNTCLRLHSRDSSSGPVEICYNQGKAHHIAYFGRASFDLAAFTPRRVSFVAIDNRRVLFLIPEPCFDEDARRLADKKIKTFIKSYFPRVAGTRLKLARLLADCDSVAEAAQYKPFYRQLMAALGTKFGRELANTLFAEADLPSFHTEIVPRAQAALSAYLAGKPEEAARIFALIDLNLNRFTKRINAASALARLLQKGSHFSTELLELGNRIFALSETHPEIFALLARLSKNGHARNGVVIRAASIQLSVAIKLRSRGFTSANHDLNSALAAKLRYLEERATAKGLATSVAANS